MARIFRCTRTAAAVLGLVWLLVTVTPVTKWMAAALMGPWSEPKGDVLIVLGGDDPVGGFIGLATYWRTAYGIWAWREGGFRIIVVSGGRGIAASMRDLFECQHVPSDRIVTESHSKSTRENALFTAALVKDMPGRKVLLTTDYHVFRSVRAFRKAGLDVTPRPFPYALKRSGAWLERWPVFLELCVELVKIAGYGVKGWI
jgi:uncharacterized SAM-binding protein YcdF (DUF218 family)